MENDIGTHVSAIWTLILPLIVPYLTAGIKKVWQTVMSRMPRWLGPIKALVAGWIVAWISSLVGVELPTDMANITETQVTGILASGVVIGAIGTWVRDFFHGIKKDFGQETLTGKAVRVVAGK